MVEHHGSQCGFCTPGFVVAMTTLCQRDTKPAFAEVRDALTGNLCRCTGYLPIITAANSAAGARFPRVEQLYTSREMIEELEKARRQTIRVSDGGSREYFKPSTLKEAAAYKKEKPGVMIIAGGTDLGVRMNKGVLEPQVIMSMSAIMDCSDVKVSGGAANIGAMTTWSTVEDWARENMPELHRMLILFGSPQIRNAGTIGGNIGNASPIADSLPMLYVLDAELELAGTAGTRRVRIDKFYKGYKQLDLGDDELIARVHLPLPKDGEILKLYKISRRKNMDISSFTAGFLMRFGNDGETIDSIRVAYGGVAPVVLRMPKTESFLSGKRMSEELMREAGEIAASEIAPISDVRGTKEYRTILAENVLLKFYFDVAEQTEEAMA
jgi:xanthine dehydrogenase small subunit